MTNNCVIVDCFCGGGGASVGIEMALGRPVDIGVNHDIDAIKMHEVNHPYTYHMHEDIFRADIKEIVKNRHVALMWASPDCTSHSRAKGNVPREAGLRILPWAVFKHAKRLRPDVIIMENVEEIQKWCPLDEHGFPIKEKEGETYIQFVNEMMKLGYDYQCRTLIAADYGAPTIRKRWYAIFRRDGREIRFPAPTHSRCGTGGLKKWVPVSGCIDFTDLGKSIFTREKPLAEKTMWRIAAGIKKFIIDDENRFIVPEKQAAAFLIHYHSETSKHVRGQSLNDPIATIDTSNRYALVSAFITKFYKTGIGQSLEEPLHTITTSPGHFGLVSAFLIKYYASEFGQSLNYPIGTIVTHDRFGLVTVVIDGETYAIADIFLRMLKPEELKRAQGFPEDYIIDHTRDGKAYPVSKQTERIGNSVVPSMAQVLVSENCGYLKVGERKPNVMDENGQYQMRLA